MISCRIPESMMKIRRVGLLIDEHQHDSSKAAEEITLLKKIKKKEIIYLSVGGIVDLERSFLLSAFGNLFTYGLLIYNLK
ncbi:hypothetical protein TNCT_616431 [Trichonephila clavata]|uniref:Uncharacterized protein n=1 Tax=Trichonephila clavata TaxID=2740835 RepID=A0A8X6KEH8_TRICU|nr:hypothetical protein TNCT_616431 [Trichonephila clavata]